MVAPFNDEWKLRISVSPWEVDILIQETSLAVSRVAKWILGVFILILPFSFISTLVLHRYNFACVWIGYKHLFLWLSALVCFCRSSVDGKFLWTHSDNVIKPNCSSDVYLPTLCVYGQLVWNLVHYCILQSSLSSLPPFIGLPRVVFWIWNPPSRGGVTTPLLWFIVGTHYQLFRTRFPVSRYKL